ncbi:hypothetical protein [Streptomyces sp. NPDC058548]|uniref:hypothetical protein n=1 Tax=Streptomyces sp. NPDC058548 TaxID=3346545 RepID=UPI00364F0643
MRTALRTAIATALVAGVALTPAVAAGTAFAADGPVTAAPAATSPASSGVRSADVKPSDEVPAEAGTDASDVVNTAKDGSAAKTPEAGTAAASAKGTLVRTETLMTGTVAKIYKVNEQNHRAELFREGHPVGVLEAITRSVAGQDNGEFFVLNPDSTTHNWSGNIAGPGTGTYRLADGTVLQLDKKDGRFGLQLIENGKGRGYTYVTGVRSVWTFGRAVVVLEQDGQFAAYIPGSSKQGAPTPVATGGTQTQPSTEPTTGGSVVVLGKCTVSRTVDIGAGTKAELFMTRQGPLAEFSTADDNGKDQVFAMVDRAHPSLPKSVGIVGRIIDPKSATPSLYTQVEGGPDAKGATHAFPKLPKGCTFETVPGGTSNGTAGTGAGTGTGITTNTGQTSVIPKGAVAAGAELGTEDDGTALLAAGAGASLAAAGLGFVVLRRRSAAARV